MRGTIGAWEVFSTFFFQRKSRQIKEHGGNITGQIAENGVYRGESNSFLCRNCKNQPEGGNADRLLSDDGSPFTAHTTNPVPVVLISEKYKGATLRTDGILADLAPTLLTIMGLPVPKEMTGKCLIK